MIKSWTLEVPPKWCKDAVATDRGWLNPKTRQLEVSSRYLKNSKPYLEVIEELEKELSTYKPSIVKKKTPKLHNPIRQKKIVLGNIISDLISNDETLTATQIKDILKDRYPGKEYKLTTINMYLSKWRKANGKTKPVGKPKQTQNDENFSIADLLENVT